MQIIELLQLIRSCNLHQVHQQLNADHKKSPDRYAALVSFYRSAAKRKKLP